MIKKRNFKRILLGTSIITVATLTGCLESKEEKMLKWANENGYEVTKIEEDLVETSESTENEVSIDEEITKLAEESYNKYKDFYDYKKFTLEDVENTVKALNGQGGTLSNDERVQTIKMIDSSILSDNVDELLTRTNTIMYVGDEQTEDKGLEEEMTVYVSPLMTELIINKDTESYQLILAYENRREKVVNEIKETGVYNEKTLKEINDAVIDQESSEYTTYNGQMSAEDDMLFLQYTLATVKANNINLAAKVNYETYYLYDENGIRYQISPLRIPNENGDVEADIQYQYYQEQENGFITDKTAKKWAKIQPRLSVTKYNNEREAIKDQLKIEDLKVSKEDLKKCREYLLSQLLKNQNKYSNYLLECMLEQNNDRKVLINSPEVKKNI